MSQATNSTKIHKVFERNACFYVKIEKNEKNLISIFQETFDSTEKTLILKGELNTSNIILLNFEIFLIFPNILSRSTTLLYHFVTTN